MEGFFPERRHFVEFITTDDYRTDLHSSAPYPSELESWGGLA
jgi:hypothetical protein